jgi:molybdenum cofactor cytidylyltransferase
VSRRTAEVASVILAAGASTRMGRPKMLLPVGGSTLLAAAVAPHLEAGVGRVIVVLGSEAEAVGRSAGLPEDPRMRIVVNEGWSEGMASSLRRGLGECGSAAAALVALGDEPGVTAERVRRIVGAWEPGVPLVVPVHGGRASHPVLFDRRLWSELESIAGDVGAREVVRRHGAEAVRVECAPLADLDTPGDYQDHLRGRSGRGRRGLKL